MRKTKSSAGIYLTSFESMQKYFKSKQLRCDIYEAMFKYEFFGEDFPEKLLKNEKIALFWELTQPLIDARVKNFLNGIKGGKPPKSEVSEGDKKPKGNPSKTQKKPKQNPAKTHAKGKVEEEVKEDAEEDASSFTDDTLREIPGGDSLAPQSEEVPERYEEGYFRPAEEVWAEYKREQAMKAKEKGEKKCTDMTKMMPSDSQDS